MTSPRPTIVWFRDDLRLSDHGALHAAAKAGGPVICLYVFDDEASGRPLGGAAFRVDNPNAASGCGCGL